MNSLSLFLREDIIWAAGLLEGEGYFGAYPTYTRIDESKGYKIVVECGMTDEDVIDRLHAIVPWACRDGKSYKGKKEMYRIRLNQADKVYAFVVALYPFMGERRQEQIRDIVSVFTSMNGQGHRQNESLVQLP